MKKIILLSLSGLLIISVIFGYSLYFVRSEYKKATTQAISSAEIEVTASELLNLTNSERKVKLTPNECLQIKATERAKQIVDTGEFSHDYQGRKPFVEMIQECIAYSHAGENLAKNFTDFKSMHQALMASPTHKTNIIGDYTQAGFGCYENVCVQFFSK